MDRQFSDTPGMPTYQEGLLQEWDVARGTSCEAEDYCFVTYGEASTCMYSFLTL